MKKIIIGAALLSVMGLSCRKGFLDINHNPNDATVSKPELILSNALVATGGEVDNPLGNFSFISGWMGYIAISGSYAINNADFTTYKQTADFGEGIWQTQYDNIADYDYVAKQSTVTGQNFYKGIGLIMRSFNYQILVDLFNNIPYTEALQGAVNLHPRYDDASTIYGDLFKRIDTAMILIRSAVDPILGPLPTADLMFAKAYPNDNPLTTAHFTIVKNLWLQFANTLKLRMLLRLSEMATKPSYFASELNIVANDASGFLTVDATVNPGYLNTAGKLSPFYGANYSATGTYTNDFWRANAFAIFFYQIHNDPRISRVYSTVVVNNNPIYVGNTLGIAGAVGSASSIFGPGVLSGYNQDVVIMLAAESYFIQAEAAARGWINGDPLTLYNQGVTESFRYLGVPNYSFAAITYTGQAGDTLTNMTTRNTVQQKVHLIIAQKWIAENMINVFEPYCDYRRFVNPGATYPGTTTIQRPLGFLNFGPPYAISQSPNVDLRAIPYRLEYPRSELNTNSTNVPTGIDHHTSKIFWMP